MRFFNFFHTYMVRKYQNEISPIFYYGKSPKTNEKDLKILILRPPDWGQPYWMTLYIYTYCMLHSRVPDINRSHLTCPGSRLGIIFWLWATQIRWQLLKTIPRICIYQSFHPQHCSAHMETVSHSHFSESVLAPTDCSGTALLSPIYYLLSTNVPQLWRRYCEE